MDEPVTLWINQLRDGHSDAAQALWNHFCERLLDVARQKLPPSVARVYDEEDVAVSAFNSLCRGISARRFPDLHDRDNLWRLLVTISARKVARRKRYDFREKRHNPTPSTATAVEAAEAALNDAECLEPSPDLAAEFAETCEVLFSRLPDDTLKQVAHLKLESYQNSEIAARLGCTRRTIERKLERIRRYWSSADLGMEIPKDTQLNELSGEIDRPTPEL